MNEELDRKVNIQKMIDHLSNIILRMVPIIPAPELFALLKDISTSRTDLNDKISRAQLSLTETSKLIEELEYGLKDRITKLNILKKEYEKYSQLAEVEEQKAKVIIQQIELAIGRNKGKERIISLFLNLLAGIIVFMLGVFLSPYLSKLIGLG
jgi:hypothetical protein